MNGSHESQGNDWNDLPEETLDRIGYTICDSENPIETIVKIGIFARCEESHSTLLHFCCDSKCPDEAIAYLIDAGIPVDAKTKDGRTPLHCAAFGGMMSTCKLLVLRGANLDDANASGETPLHLAARWQKNSELAVWFLEQPRANRLQWDNFLFSSLIWNSLEAALMYLDKFAVKKGNSPFPEFDYLDLHLIIGDPQNDINTSALAIAVNNVESGNVLTHPVMENLVKEKFCLIKMYFLREVIAFFGLLLSYHTTTMFGAIHIIDFGGVDDYCVIAIRVFGWICCGYLIIFVEYNEFQGGNYFNSYWNWLNMISYGAILLSIPLEFIGGSTSSAHYGLLALICVSLWINMLQYLRLSQLGLLIAMMERMMHDVRQFFTLYVIFLVGFSSAFYILFHDTAGYESFFEALITVLLMLFGNLDYGPFSKSTGWKWVFSNLLLAIYLLCAVIILLNVLIATMTASYDSVTKAAESQQAFLRAETCLRVERSIPLSFRKFVYRAYMEHCKGIETTKISTSHSDDGDLMHISDKSKSDITRDTEITIHLMEDEPEDSTATSYRSNKAGSWLKPLEANARVKYRRNKTKSRSTQIECQLNGLRADNQEMMAQIRALTATITELQKHRIEDATQR